MSLLSSKTSCEGYEQRCGRVEGEVPADHMWIGQGIEGKRGLDRTAQLRVPRPR